MKFPTLRLWNRSSEKETQEDILKFKNMVIGLLRQNMGMYQHQLNDWKTARELRHDVNYPLTYALQQLYFDALNDAHLRSALESRILRIVNQEFIIENEDGSVNEDKTKLINAPWFTDVIRYAMESLFYGYSVIMIEESQRAEIRKVRSIPREHIIPEKGWIIHNITDTDKGFPYAEFPNHLLYAQLATDATGLLETAVPMTILKRHSWGSWDEFEQRFGLPLAIAKIAGNDKTRQREVSNWLKDLGQASSAVLGLQDEIEVIANGQTDSYKVFFEKISIVNSEISKLINGQTMTSDNGSSKSQSEVHERTQDEITKADKREIIHWLNQVLKPALIYHGYPLSKDDEFAIFEKASPEERIKIDKDIINAGYRLTDDYMERTYNVEIDKTFKKEEPPTPEPPKEGEETDEEKLKKVDNFFH